MSIVVALRPELEAWLEEEAAREGVTPGEAVARALEAQRAAKQTPTRLSDAELTERIRHSFSQEFWSRYRPLYRKLWNETITEEERREFIRLNDQVEAKTVVRTELLIELSRRRGQTLPQTMQELGIGPEVSLLDDGLEEPEESHQP